MSSNILMPTVRLGNTSSKSLVIFIAGFPDTATTAFGPLLENLAEDHRVYAICFPGNEYSSLTQPRRRWGYSWRELLEALHFSIQELQKEDGTAFESFILIGHDWGSYLSSLYQKKYSSAVEKLVLLDVLVSDSGHHQFSYIQLISILFYQWAFALAYLVHEGISKKIGNILFYVTFYIFLAVLFPSIGKPQRSLTEIDASFLYPYYYFWRDYFHSAKQQQHRLPTCATLFLYGADKTLHFHSYHAAAELSSMPNCVVKCVPGGHWFHLEQSAKVLKEIRAFLGDI